MTRTHRSFARIAANDLRTVQTLMNSTTDRAVIVSAPPGGGKSTLVRALARVMARPAGALVPVIVQTNNQADDLIIGLHRSAPWLTVGRLHAPGRLSPAVAALARVAGSRLHTSTDVNDLLAAKAKIIVAPARKWAFTTLNRDLEWAIIDEAFQMRSDDLFFVAGLAHRLLCIGDAGQLDPFSTLDTQRWQNLPYSPILPAMVGLMASIPGLPQHALDHSHRLPASAAPIISDVFYPTTPFKATTSPTSRTLSLNKSSRRSHGHDLDAVLDLATDTGWGYAELPARHTPPDDPDVADTLAALAARLLQRRATVTSELPHEKGGRLLEPADIAVAVTHVSQVHLVETALTAAGVPAGIAVATANRIQGREYAVTLVLHPLSGRRDTSSFITDPGRAAVLLSRHRHSSVVVGRANIEDCLLRASHTDERHIDNPRPRVDPIEAHWSILDHLARHRPW